MTNTWMMLACAIAAIGCAMIAGFFLTFSDFIMRSLRLADASAGIEVMQIINREIWKSTTMVMLWGTLVLSGVLGVYAYAVTTGPSAGLVVTGAALYIAGVFGVSQVFNIPMNNRLEAMDHTETEAAAYWRAYVPRWVFWNYFRVLASAGSAICFLAVVVQ